MTTIVQVEFRESLLSIRDEILQSLGHPVVSVLGSRGTLAARFQGNSSSMRLMGWSAIRAEALAEQKRVRELLAQSRELLKQMQAG